MAFLARSLGLGRLAAGIAAILSLLVSSLFGPGLQGLYAIGLVSHQLGAPLFCLALGALLRVPLDTRWRWVLLAAVSLAALAITHLISRHGPGRRLPAAGVRAPARRDSDAPR